MTAFPADLEARFAAQDAQLLDDLFAFTCLDGTRAVEMFHELISRWRSGGSPGIPLEKKEAPPRYPLPSGDPARPMEPWGKSP